MSAAQFERAAEIRKQIDELSAELEGLFSVGRAVRRCRPAGRRGKISAAGRARIAAAQRERWAKHRAAATARGKAKGSR